MRLPLRAVALVAAFLATAAFAQDWEALRNQAEQDPQALARLQQAAGSGHAEAAFFLGTLYAPPICKAERTVPKSWEQALHWYRIASDLGVAKADFDLGLAYEKGLGVRKNPALARYYYRRLMTQAAREVGVPADRAEALGTGEAYSRDAVTGRPPGRE
ncbi:sel1 repeat family protein [Acidithiobacillus sp. AMEEHan]|uniref:tetratricopeptide repeat protein n=1 Tax=Acidithiobacillus sp. AMEEHan TaxID=2994951 RepID=UPI0027E59C3D|nr:sel1 repeat family protein [Acidithiobacillus sp. AMEEHan]